MTKLNSDDQYAEIAKNWEGDMLFVVDAGENLAQPITYYLDLWHGKCRDAFTVTDGQNIISAFTLKGTYDNYKRILKGELEPMQAMLTRKLSVQGNFVIMMRNIPTVLDFVRCCREVTDSFV